MGLFEKKYCDLCGDKVNALTRQKSFQTVIFAATVSTSSVRFHQAGKTGH